MKAPIAISLALIVSLPAMAQPDGQPMAPEKLFIQQLDTDKSGGVSLDEFLAPQKKKYQFIDANKDGAISEQEAANFFRELQKRMKQMQQRRQAQPR